MVLIYIYINKYIILILINNKNVQPIVFAVKEDPEDGFTVEHLISI